MSLPVMDEIAGVNTVDGCPHCLKTKARWVNGFCYELNSHVFDLVRDGLHQLHLALELP